jgi:hypothetical protein
MAAFTIVERIVGISIGLFVAAVMLPLAMTQLGNATWGNTNPAVVTMVTVLVPVIASVGIVLLFLYHE